MVTVNNNKQIKKELERVLRNSDIISIVNRGVTTTTLEVTLSADTSYLLNVANVKNIRSITGLTFGTDYLYDVDYLDTTIKCNITFTTAKTGVFSIVYDSGDRDSIYYGYPRIENNLDNYPFVSIYITSSKTDPISSDGHNYSQEFMISFGAFCKDDDSVDDLISSIKSTLYNNYIRFYYLRFLRPLNESPILYDPNRQNKIVFKTIDFIAPLNEEFI